MALVDTTWYANSVGYTAVAQFAISTAYTAGQICRQLATPAVGSERVFIVIVAGTSAASEPSWTLTRGAKTTTGTATFQEVTGQAALNGDLTNTATWAQVKAATPAVLGQIIKRSSGASYQICTTAGAMSASEPAFSDTAGTTTTDTTAVWTSLGAVGSYTGGMAPFARLASACATNWLAAGGTVFVGSNHAETQSTAISITTPGASSGVIAKVICHNSAGSYPPASGDVTTGATITTTGNSAITITIGGSLYVNGVAFRAGSGASGASGIVMTSSGASANQSWARYDNCSFQLHSTQAAANAIQVSGLTGVGVIFWDNVKVRFGNVANYIYLGQMAQFRWQSTGTILESGSAVPTSLFNWATFMMDNAVVEAVDLSQVSGALVTTGSNAVMGSLMLADCKLHASAVVNTPFHTGMTMQLSRSSA